MDAPDVPEPLAPCPGKENDLADPPVVVALALRTFGVLVVLGLVLVLRLGLVLGLGLAEPEALTGGGGATA